MAYKPIESYGVIGDLNTVALVGMDGSIDWCCLPHFDSPSIFAAILDERKGGFFKIASLYETQHKQMYLPDSNVLLTRFLSPEGVGEVVDFMPIQDAKHGKKVHQIVRVVRSVRGAVRFRLECQPAFDYARRPQGPEDAAMVAELGGTFLEIDQAVQANLNAIAVAVRGSGPNQTLALGSA